MTNELDAHTAAEVANLVDLLMDLETRRTARTELIRIAAESSPQHVQLVANHVAGRFVSILLNEATLSSVGTHARGLSEFLFTARRLILDIHPPTDSERVS